MRCRAIGMRHLMTVIIIDCCWCNNTLSSKKYTGLHNPVVHIPIDFNSIQEPLGRVMSVPVTIPELPGNTSDYKYCMKCGSKLVDRIDHNGVQRKACSGIDGKQCDYIFYDNPVIVVAAIVEHTDNTGNTSIILARGVGWPSGWYGLITGFLERNENVVDGLIREVEEELGLKASNPQFIGCYDFIRANQVILAYSVQASGTIKLDTSELVDYKRVELNELKYWSQGTGLAVRYVILLLYQHNIAYTTIHNILTYIKYVYYCMIEIIY